MKQKRFSALAFCSLLLSGLCGCDLIEMQDSAVSSADTAAAQRFEIDAYKETVETLKDLWKKHFLCTGLLLLHHRETPLISDADVCTMLINNHEARLNCCHNIPSLILIMYGRFLL